MKAALSPVNFAVGPAARPKQPPLLLQGAQRAGKHGVGNGGGRDAQVERHLAGPLASALLLGGVENEFAPWACRSRIFLLRISAVMPTR